MVRFRQGEIDAWLLLHQAGKVVTERTSTTVDDDQLSLFGGA